MYLKSIEVQGFKSFANKIVFKFHNGITGIVGPNGSGKSNVSDAVRWVLGEQSAKSLRGSNMQDVIFSGTENRKAMGYASVAITLDNSDHKLSIDYEEVTVTRRVYRSGESEYLINGAACRLKDIHELFYDTGIGKEGYSIIGQGQIEKILSGKPDERRELFDEAAGIVKFKRRKITAQKKLEDERQNLIRVNDILSELSKQIGPLERQAETAKIYLKKKEELKTLDVNMFLLEMERMKGQIKEVESNLAISQEDLDGTRQEYENTKEEYQKLEQEIEELNLRIEDEKEKTNKNRLMKQQLEGQIDVLKEQIKAAGLQKVNFQNRLENLERDIAVRGEQKEKESQEVQQLKENAARIQEREEDSSLEAEAIQAEISHFEQEIEESKNGIIQLLNERASTKAKLQRYTTMLEQSQIRKAELNQQILKLKSEESEQSDSLAEEEKKYKEISAEIDELLKQSEAYEDETNQYQEKLAKLNHNAEVGQQAYHREASRLESLKNITERYDGYGNSIRKVMEQKDREKGILGVVADLIKVEKEYETAIETALGGSIQNIVTQDEDTAKRMIGFLKKNKFGRSTFLPLTSMGNRSGFQNEAVLKETGVIGLASQLVKTEKKYEGLTANLLGRTVVVDTIDHAVVISKKYRYSIRMVTLDGELLSPGGSMTGGAFRNSSNLLGRRREIEELTENVTLLKTELEQAHKEIEVCRGKRNQLRQKIVEVSQALQKRYIIQNTAKMEIAQLQEKKESTASGFVRLKEEGAEIDHQGRQIKEEQKLIEQELLESENQEKVLEETVSGLQKSLEQTRGELDLHKGKSEAIHLELAQINQKLEFADQNLKRIAQEITTLETEKERVVGKIEESKADEIKKEHDISEIQETIDSAAHVEDEAGEMMNQLAARKEEMNQSHKSFFAKREELSDKIARLDKECFRLKSQQEKLDEVRENQINYMWEEYQLTYNAALELRDEACQERSQLKKSIQTLKSEIKGLGNVNVNAIEDFKELSERHEFLNTQHDDLITAEKALMEIIEELDNGMRTQFREKFSQIQVEFDKAFKELFGGGKGTLELVEDEDILEAGVVIISQPPGKKLQNMMQLSGGEKALTAIALLFAIQNLKPSPFCLLDEIEAALDESNVTRYASYLHKLTKHTQFIIITHRRGTMAAADRLYGITMQEKGVSALVSVNLIEDELDA